MDTILIAIQSRLSGMIQQIIGTLGNQNWLGIIGVIIATFIAERFLLFVLSNVYRLTKKTSTDLDDKIIERSTRPVGNFVLIFGAYVLLQVIAIPAGQFNLASILGMAIKIAVVINVLWLFWRLTDVLGLYLISKVVQTSSTLDDQLIPILKKSLKAFILIIGSIYVIQALGYSISGVVAGLGIGGLAVAMAAKDTLANFFGSIMIFTDSPFRVGDWIRVGDDEGVVEQIGFRSTRIRTFPKTLISVPNSLVANASVNNYTRMPKRRVKMSVGVTYSTTANQMETLVEGIKKILADHKGVNTEFSLVNFTDFGASSLDVLVYYFTKTTDWSEHLAVRQEVNLAIMRYVEELELSIAFPTRTVHLVNEQPATPA